MKLSVALTTYNGEQYIAKQLESILAQEVPVDEVIISDDGSKDNTVHVVEDFIRKSGKQNWKIHVNEKNLGYAQNFIQAVLRTSGDIIFLCDQDDVWKTNKTKRMVDFFKNDPGLWMVHTDIDLIDKEGKTIANNYDKLRQGYNILSFDEYARRLNYCGMASAFSSKLRDKIETLDLSEIPTHDWILGAIASIEGKFATDDIVLTQRRQHSNNAELKQKNDRPSKENRIEYIELYNRFYESLVSVLSSDNVSHIEELAWLNQRIDINSKRIKYLRNGSILTYLSMIGALNSYPSKATFFSEIRYFFR